MCVMTMLHASDSSYQSVAVNQQCTVQQSSQPLSLHKMLMLCRKKLLQKVIATQLVIATYGATARVHLYRCR